MSHYAELYRIKPNLLSVTQTVLCDLNVVGSAGVGQPCGGGGMTSGDANIVKHRKSLPQYLMGKVVCCHMVLSNRTLYI